MKNFILAMSVFLGMLLFTGCTEDSSVKAESKCSAATKTETKKCSGATKTASKCGTDTKKATSTKCSAGKCGEGKCGAK